MPNIKLPKVTWGNIWDWAVWPLAIASVVLLFLGMYFALYNAAKKYKFIGFYRNGKYLFVSRGDRGIRKIVFKSEEWVFLRYGKRKGTTISADQAFGAKLHWLIHPQWWQLSLIDKILWPLGLFWVGFPLWSELYHYNLEYEKQTDPNKFEMVKQSPFRTDQADFAHSYPIAFPAVELKDNLSVNLAAELLVFTIVPERAVITRDGKWFQTVMSGVQGAVIKYCQSQTFEQLRDLDKSSPTSGLVKAVLELNQHMQSAAGSIADMGMGVEDATGVRIEGFYLRDLALPEESGEIKKALEAKKRAELEAAALIADATGKATALGIRATAEANYHKTVGTAKADVSKERRDKLGNDSLREREIGAEALATLTNLTGLAIGTNVISSLPLGSSSPVTPPATNPPTGA